MSVISTLSAKMGFDIYIKLVLHLCRENGKPFFYDRKEDGDFFKNYEIPDLEIPKQHRRFLQERGRIFHAYTGAFEYNDLYTIDVEEFLDQFPEWEEVKDSDYYDENDETWTEEDHDQFKEALTWFSKQKLCFEVSWC